MQYIILFVILFFLWLFNSNDTKQKPQQTTTKTQQQTKQTKKSSVSYEQPKAKEKPKVEQKPKKEQKPKPAPKADEELILENVVLKGVFIEGEGGFIIIEEQKMTYFVSLNEEYKGYKLIKITPNSAIFEKSSKTYILYLEKEKKEQLRQEKSSLKTSFKQNLFTIKRSKLSEYKRNISSLLRDISFSKIRYNGKDAYKITYLKKNSVFYKNGLKVGDVIVGVNGGDLTNQRRLANLYNNMASLNSLVLDIVRNNEKKELYYEVD